MLKVDVKAVAAALIAATMLANASHAGMAKTYQVTGPVVSATDDTIVVQKGNDMWEIGRDSSTNVSGELKPGSKVTVEYRMTATSVEVKGTSGKTPKSAGGATKSKSQ
jgi:hypothetical protein